MVQKVKVILLGQENVGKTSLISRFVNGVSPKNSEATIGATFKSHRIFRGGRELDLHIWDTAGQERFSHFLPLYIHNAKVALICFELPHLDTIKSYVKKVRHIDPEILIILVATKVDLYGIPLTDKYELIHTEVEKYAEKGDLNIVYTSSKTGQGVNEVFEMAIDQLELLKKLFWEPTIALEEEQVETTRCC